MARGLFRPSQSKTTSHFILTSISRVSSLSKSTRNPFPPNSLQFAPSSIRSNRLLVCSCSDYPNGPINNISQYKETFSKRMAMAGFKPHHRIGIGVSGGPYSMALCVLVAAWKSNSLNADGDKSSGFIDGLLAIIVDHELRAESEEEANTVLHRILDVGIRCEIACCEWSDGRPKQGHLQEAARDMRYQNFQNVCIQHQIGVLLIAHHADDQICRWSKQDWVEDPTNQSTLFARNRIRMSLKNWSSSGFKSELQAVVSACQRTRLYVYQTCSDLMNKAVTVMDQGYAVIDLEILNPSNIHDICLAKFIALVLQFISQRHRPVAVHQNCFWTTFVLSHARLLLQQLVVTFVQLLVPEAPKSSFVALPILVCLQIWSCFTNSLVKIICNLPRTEIEQIIRDGKSYSDRLVPNISDVLFLNVKSSDSVINEAKRLNILSESTNWSILSLQRAEVEHFKSKTEVVSEKSSSTPSTALQPGHICYFMNRFMIMWKLNSDRDLGGESQHYYCRSCQVGDDMTPEVRHMVEADWLYLSKLLKGQNVENPQMEQGKRQMYVQSMQNHQHKGLSCH